ncbi:MAG: hypothetical protein ACFFCM_09685 [Promethearchaeota archaeon]
MFLRRFKEFPKEKFVFLLTIVGFAIVVLLYIFVFTPIESSVSTYGILDYEFAWTTNRVETIFSVWGADGMIRQTSAIYWDFLYIVGYVSLALGLILLVLRRSEGKMQTLGLYFTLTPFLTGIFDVLENINLLIMLGTPTAITQINPFLASLFALIKFSFLFTAIGYFISALIMLMIKKFKKS